MADEPLVRLVDDLDDLARPRLNDYPAVIDNRVAIFGMAGNGPQFDARRQRLAHHDPLPYHNGRSPLGLNRRDYGIGNFHGGADRGAHGAADDLTNRASDLATRPGAVRCAGCGGGLSKRSARRQQRRSHERNSKTILHRVLLQGNGWSISTIGPEGCSEHLRRFHRAPWRYCGMRSSKTGTAGTTIEKNAARKPDGILKSLSISVS